MLHGSLTAPAQNRVNPIVPAIVVVAGLVWLILGHALVGGGIAIGAVLAYVHGVMLSRRVDLASMTGNVGTALMVMQMGLLTTLTIIGLAAYIMIRISLSMAVAGIAGFAATQIMILAVFYLMRVRHNTASEAQTT